MQDKIRIALIYGSTRQGRFCDTVADWAAGEIAQRDDFTLELIDPARLSLPQQHSRQETAALKALRHSLDKADAFVVVTPEYNHSFTAALKFVIDSAYVEWQAKPVAFVSYGGLSGGIRAVEQLRNVFAELHAVTIRDNIAFANAWERFDANARLRELAPAHSAMTKMLDQLHWWAVALRNARSSEPYSKAA